MKESEFAVWTSLLCFTVMERFIHIQNRVILKWTELKSAQKQKNSFTYKVNTIKCTWKFKDGNSKYSIWNKMLFLIFFFLIIGVFYANTEMFDDDSLVWAQWKTCVIQKVYFANEFISQANVWLAYSSGYVSVC